MAKNKVTFTNWEDTPIVITPKLAAALLNMTYDSLIKNTYNVEKEEPKGHKNIPGTKFGNEWRYNKDQLRARFGKAAV